jgi:hypothetical protein
MTQEKEIFELPEHLDKVREEPKEQPSFSLPSVAKPLTPNDTSALGVSGLGSVATPINEETKKKPRVKKVVDDSTRELLLDKLKKSRKIKELTHETSELKNKLAKLESEKAESVPIIKYDEPKVKKTITRKVKTIDEPIQKQDEIKQSPPVENKPILLEVPIEKPKIIFSTMKMPIW